ncbi:serine hydrolase [Hymenobacter glaciei]|uniref:Serine hydrolase n=1 Tax=Hymenobacter glaciei TaxID=877209 RepID=A0ABP7UP25_9BACT
MKLFFAACSYFLLIPLLQGQALKQRVDAYLLRELKKFDVPNVEVIIVTNDSVIYTKSVGGATSPDTPYYLGSVSKSLTAFGVLTLVEKGLLTLDQPVTTVIPTLHFTGGKKITIRHLLNHTSGIAKKTGFDVLPLLREVERAGFSVATTSLPGQRHEYSNMNYALLGLIIEKVSGRSFQQYMAEQVFAPMGMTHSRIGSSEQNEDRVISQYQYWGPFAIKRSQVNYSLTAVPAGFICSSAADMGKYVQANLNNGTVGTTNALDSNLMKAMHTPWTKGRAGYAMGWNQGSYNGKRLLQHLGSTATSYSGIFLLPDDNLGLVVLTNSNSMGFSEGLMEGILSIITGGEAKSPSGNELYLRWLIALLTLFVVGRLAYKVVLMWCTGHPDNTTRSKEIRGFAISILCFGGGIFLFGKITNVPFTSMLKLQPDVGLLILLAFGSTVFIKLLRLVQLMAAPLPPK